MSRQRTWIELLNTYGFGLQSFYELFEASKFWWNRPSMEGQKSLTFIKCFFHLCFEEEEEKHYGFGMT